MQSIAPSLRLLAGILQILFMAIFSAAAFFLVIYSTLSVVGATSWLVLPLQFGTILVDAGPAVQIGVSMLALGLVVYLPANRRVLALEAAHRDFALHMSDVAHAYAAVHQADREGVFKLSHEFDAVKERIAFLRDHPDLGMLEPDVLEVAAQMGVISHELADMYSLEKVERARNFLIQRQEEIAAFQDQLEEAKALANDIQNWAMRVELEEDVAKAELDRLTQMLDEILPAFEKEDAQPPTPAALPKPIPNNMINLADRQAAE